MDAESFTELALRVISREATDDDRRALDAEISAMPARREEFDRLKITHDILRATAPMAQAAQATTPELPAYRVNELRAAVRQQFGPATGREKQSQLSCLFLPILRWFFGGTAVGALGFAIVIACFSNRTIEVGLYGSSLMRDGNSTLSTADVPTARIVTFEQDAPFDQWQNQPLAWNEHAKIWVDNEHDLLHIVRRVRVGHVVTETQPLAPTDQAQREQIKQVVASLTN
jgi:hypothetical protein